jgi:hypothetical protein
LTTIASQLASLSPPACAAEAHESSIAAMKLTIQGYQTLQAKKEAGSLITDSIDQLSAARARVDALPGKPEPTATPLPTVTPLPTFTPLPTATPTATPVPTATPAPRAGTISAKTAQVFETSTSTQPIKTLLRDTPVQVFELQKGRIHIRADGVEGWVSQSSVLIK